MVTILNGRKLSLAQDAPIEVLQRVLSELFAERTAGEFDFRPRFELVPLMGICKQWYAAAKQLLYTRISLGYSDLGKTPMEVTLARAQACLTCLQNRPDLAQIVRELRLRPNENDRRETRECARVIEACPHLRNLTICSWRSENLDDLKEATIRAKALRSLTIARCGPPAMLVGSSKSFFSIRELASIIGQWPLLEQLKLGPNALTHTTGWQDHAATLSSKQLEEIDAYTTSVGKQCSSIRVIESSNLDDEQLEVLSRLTPNLLLLKDEGGTSSSAAYNASLRRWASSLQYLQTSTTVRSYASSDAGWNRLHVPVTIEDSLSILTKLRRSSLQRRRVPPKALRTAPESLIELVYEIDDLADLDQIADVLEMPRAMPALRQLWIYGLLDLEVLVPPRLWDACLRRDIKLHLKYPVARMVKQFGLEDEFSIY